MTSASIAPVRPSISASAVSLGRNRRRRAEQRWPAEPKAEATTSSITCSRSAVVSTNMPFRPPVSAMKGTIGPSPPGQRLG